MKVLEEFQKKNLEMLQVLKENMTIGFAAITDLVILFFIRAYTRSFRNMCYIMLVKAIVGS